MDQSNRNVPRFRRTISLHFSFIPCVLPFESEKKEFDKIFESHGVSIFCDVKSWIYVRGCEIDFSTDLLNGGFKVNNPNATRTCGCGISFSA